MAVSGALAALVLVRGGPLVLAAIPALFAASVLVAVPRLATVAVAFLLYANVPVLVHQRLGVPSAIAGSVLLLLSLPLADHVVLRRRGLVFDRTIGLMGSFLLVLLGGVFLARDAGVALERIGVFLVEGLLLYWLIVNVVRDEDALRDVVIAILAAGVLVSSLSIFQTLTGQFGNDFGGLAQRSELAHRAFRATGHVDEPNRFAQTLVVLVPLAVYLFRTVRRGSLRLPILLGGGAVLWGIALTYSRGAFVTLLAMFLAARVIGWIRTRTLVTVSLAAILLAPAIAPSVVTRVRSIGASVSLFSETSMAEPDGAIRGRATEMLAAWNVFRDHPILGVGPGQYMPFYSVEYHRNPATKFREIREPRRAHSLYMEVAAETGLVGLVVFLALVGLLLRELHVLSTRLAIIRPALAHLSVALWLALLGYLGTAVFLHLAYERYFWFLVGLCAAATHVGRRALEQAGPDDDVLERRAPALPVRRTA